MEDGGGSIFKSNEHNNKPGWIRSSLLQGGESPSWNENPASPRSGRESSVSKHPSISPGPRRTSDRPISLATAQRRLPTHPPPSLYRKIRLWEAGPWGKTPLIGNNIYKMLNTEHYEHSEKKHLVETWSVQEVSGVVLVIFTLLL